MTKARDIASAIPAPSTISSAELGFLDGVTSAVQTQIDSKIAQATAINPTIVDAKGDLIGATADNTPARIPIGANNTVLTADSAQALGLKWAAAASAGSDFTLLGTTTASGATTTITGLSGYNSLRIVFDTLTQGGSANTNLSIRLNTSTASQYDSYWGRFLFGTVLTLDSGSEISNNTTQFANFGTSASRTITGHFDLFGANTANKKLFQGRAQANGAGDSQSRFISGVWNNTSVVSSISFMVDTSSFSAGTIKVYGSVI